MFAANKMQLTCLGVTKIFVKYFEIEEQITVYVMKELSDEYVMIDKETCQKLKILPQEYPLPLYMCDKTKMKTPRNQSVPTARRTPRYNKSERIQRIPEITHETTHDWLPRKRRGRRHGNGGEPKPKMASMMSCAVDGNQVKPDINVTTSFNDDEDKTCAIQKLNKLLENYSYVFDITARKQIKVQKVKLRFKKDVPIIPFKCTSSKPIPYALRQAARKEIAEQIDLGIIARVPPNAEIDWCSRGMILEKPNGGKDVRLVVDAKEINEVLDRDPYPMQSTKELVKQIPPSAKYFLSVDFYKGYYQILLAEEDELKTTFMLHSMGLYYFKRLPQGGKCSVDIFNRITDELVIDIPNCLKIVDDVMFYG